MRKLTYEQLKKDKRFEMAQKPWYSAYPFRVSFKGWDMFDGNYLNMFQKHSSVKSRVSSLGHEFKTRHDAHYHIYLKTIDAVSDIIKYFNSEVVHIAGPLSDNHKELMIQDITTVYRTKFYYNRFKYKISFNKSKQEMDIYEDIVDFVTSSFDTDCYYLNTTLKSYSHMKKLDEEYSRNTGAFPGVFGYRRGGFLPYRSTGTVYLIRYEDVCSMQMLYKTDITSSNKVVLIEDLE